MEDQVKACRDKGIQVRFDRFPSDHFPQNYFPFFPFELTCQDLAIPFLRQTLQAVLLNSTVNAREAAAIYARLGCSVDKSAKGNSLGFSAAETSSRMPPIKLLCECLCSLFHSRLLAACHPALMISTAERSSEGRVASGGASVTQLPRTTRVIFAFCGIFITKTWGQQKNRETKRIPIH